MSTENIIKDNLTEEHKKTTPKTGVKHFNIYGSWFYDKVKYAILNGDTDQEIMTNLQPDFEKLKSIDCLQMGINNIHELYSLILQSAITENNPDICKIILNRYHPYILTNTNESHHTSIFELFRSPHRIHFLPDILAYINRYSKELKEENALLNDDRNVVIELMEELSFKVPLREQDDYLTNILFPLYSDLPSVVDMN